jgi:hemerythrin-like metal-binding protein
VVAAMNEQHQILIEIMNRLHDQFESGASRVEPSKSLDELANFTVKHFRQEEAYMASIYPTLDSRKLIHANLLEEFGVHRAAFEKNGEVTSGFSAFLKLWLEAHIMGIDKKYGTYSA